MGEKCPVDVEGSESEKGSDGLDPGPGVNVDSSIVFSVTIKTYEVVRGFQETLHTSLCWFSFSLEMKIFTFQSSFCLFYFTVFIISSHLLSQLEEIKDTSSQSNNDPH